MNTLELIRLSQMGDTGARNRVITENVGLIWSIVRRFLGRGQEAEDLFQIGCIGLMKAVDKFELSYDVKFSTYAVPMITGEIKRFLRDDGMIKVSRTLKETASRVKKVQETLENEFGREPTLAELAASLQLAEEEIVMALDSSAEVESLNKTIYHSDGSDIVLMDKIAEEVDQNERLINHMALKKIISELDEREQSLIRMRFFEERTQTQVAEAFGISQVQVSRMEKKLLLRLREQLII